MKRLVELEGSRFAVTVLLEEIEKHERLLRNFGHKIEVRALPKSSS